MEAECYTCGETGHISKFCPNKKPSGGGSSKYRAPLKVKKFFCALHKDDKSKRCDSNSCIDLRKMKDAQLRVVLLKENKDCMHCCGDHEPKDCKRKDRVCGGGKPSRGCDKGHKIHELFCTDAQVCMMVMHAKSQNAGEDKSEGVVLCIMLVRVPRGIIAYVFWDNGSTSNFICEEFAKRCGFKGKPETLSVTTLGGKVTDYLQVVKYSCRILDENGDSYVFEAYGLENITGRVAHIPLEKLRKLFPHTSEKTLQLLRRGDKVDILIGVAHWSWHPQPETKATGGGDLWMASCPFGVCVGGRHPLIKDGTKKSDDIFTVNHTYFNETSVPSHFSSHKLEYCPARTSDYAPSVDKFCSGFGSMDNTPAPTPGAVASCAAAVAQAPLAQAPLMVDLSPLSSVNPTPADDVEPVVALDADLTTEAVDHLRSSDATTSEEEAFVQVPPDASMHVAEFFVEGGLNIGAVHFSPGEQWKPDESVSTHCVVCAASLTVPFSKEQFFQAEALGTVVEPQCGGCKCGKCPVPGSTYSFKEQKEYDLIMKNLYYDKEKKRWFTHYPWKCARCTLPKNKAAA